MKKVLKILLAIIAFVLLVALIYVAYVFISYYRLEDNLDLEVQNAKTGVVQTNKQLKLLSWNIGFGAYEADYDFFMDGGTQSWATSKEALQANMEKISGYIEAQGANFNFIQEVDYNSTRTYHVDERPYIVKALSNQSYVFAQNYDSPFLFYPFTQPHGKSKAGIITFSDYGITSAVRRSLPIEQSVAKLVDLDRCYSVSRVPVENGKELVLFNLHLSAYTTDGTIAIDQLKMLVADMQAEYEKGNYCIAGGDFNKDVVGLGCEVFGVEKQEYNWAQPIPDYVFDGSDIELVAPFDANNPVASCRLPDTAFWEGQFQITVDGFMVSPNVEVKEAEVLDTGFAYSDHNPVLLTFCLKD